MLRTTSELTFNGCKFSFELGAIWGGCNSLVSMTKFCFFGTWNTDASRTGVAQETVQNAVLRGKTMIEQEARQVLGVGKESTWEEVLKVWP